MNNATIIKTTSNWIKNVVIKNDFCPFAAKPWKNKNIHYQVVQENKIELLLEVVLKESWRLDKQPEIETTLIIFPHQLNHFDNYLDFLELSQNLLSQQNYDGIYQIASFHPNYLFAGSTASDPANYTNRSPYPMLHLLREESLEQALHHYENPELIPERNIATAEQIGLEALKKMRAHCFEK